MLWNIFKGVMNVKDCFGPIKITYKQKHLHFCSNLDGIYCLNELLCVHYIIVLTKLCHL